MFARLSLCFTLAAAAASPAAPAPLSETIPAGAFAYIEADGLGETIRGLRGSEFARAVWQSPEYADFKTTEDYANLQKGRKFVEFVLRMDLWEAAEKLLGGQLGLALYPKEGSDQPDALLVVRPASRFAYLKQRLWLDPLFMVAGRRVLEGPLAETEGVKVWRTKGEGDASAFVLLGTRWFALATRQGLLEQAIAPDGDKLAGSEFFDGAAARLGEGKLVRAVVDTGAVSAAAGGRMGIPEKAAQAFASFLGGGFTELVANSTYAGLGLGLEGGRLAVEAVCDGDPAGLPERFRVFFTDPPAAGSRPLPQVPGLVGGVTIYRDLARWYQGREHYLQPQVLPAFDKFETGIGNLLPGHDIGEDVLPLFGSNFTMVSALQDFDHLGGTPGVQLPGFAIIASLQEPEEATDVLQLLFQTFLSVLNLQAAEQKRQPWLIETADHAGAKITFARYLDKPAGDDLPTVFNFQPASARVGDEFVFSSSVQLCRDLIDTLSAADRSEVEAEDLRMTLTGANLGELLGLNRQHLEAAQVAKGRDAEQAARDVDGLLALVGRLDALSLTTLCDRGGFRLRLEAGVQPAPDPAAAAPAPPDAAPGKNDAAPAP